MLLYNNYLFNIWLHCNLHNLISHCFYFLVLFPKALHAFFFILPNIRFGSVCFVSACFVRVFCFVLCRPAVSVLKIKFILYLYLYGNAIGAADFDDSCGLSAVTRLVKNKLIDWHPSKGDGRKLFRRRVILAK